MQAWTSALAESSIDAIPVFFVDEDPTFLRITTRMMEEYYTDELTVVGMSSGTEEVLDQVRRLKPQVLLLGLHRNSMSSLHIIARLRAIMPHIKIIVLGQFDMHNSEQAALEAGADAFIPKVVLKKTLLSVIQRTLGTHIAPNHHYQPRLRFPTMAMDYMPVF